MNNNSSHGYKRPTGGRMVFDRRRSDQKRNLLLGAIAVVGAAVLVFTFLIFAELFGWFEKTPDDPIINDPITPTEKFNTTVFEIPSKDIHAGDLILINATHPYVFPQNAPTFVNIRSGRAELGKTQSGNSIYSYYTQSGEEHCAKMEADTLKLFQQWTDDFYKATGNYDLFIYDEDGYRTREEQEDKYNSKPLGYAQAGATEHHTGTVIDLYGQVSSKDPVYKIDTGKYKEIYQWLYDNAHKYGFVLRYAADKLSVTGVDYENYHFRQVGYEHAYYMSQNNLCLEEYLELIRTQYTYSGEHLTVTADNGKAYELYYVASAGNPTGISVPKDSNYSISGDNMNGFIVTITR